MPAARDARPASLDVVALLRRILLTKLLAATDEQRSDALGRLGAPHNGPVWIGVRVAHLAAAQASSSAAVA
jgi:hypothetical protein